MEDADGDTIEAKAALLLRLRRAGVRDIAVMRAFEATPREAFAPFRFRDLAARNVALPIGCGQTMPAPSDLAWRLEALGVERGCRVLEIGSGSGYGAAVLSRLAGEVVSVERFETLAIEARTRLRALDIANVTVLFADGLALGPELGRFDRVILHMSFREPPQAILELLEPGGAAILGCFDAADSDDARAGERALRVSRDGDAPWSRSDLGPCRLGAALEGTAKAL